MLKLLKRWYHTFKWYIPLPLVLVSLPDDRRMKTIAQQINQLKTSKGKKLLYIPSYYQIKLPRMFDFVMALALKARGADITPVLIQDFYPAEDVIFGGIYNEQRAHKIAHYSKLERLLWIDLLKTKPLYLNDFLTQADRDTAASLVDNLSFEKFSELTFQGYPVGEKALYATKNMNNTPVLTNTSQTLFELKEHAKNCIKLLLVYPKILSQDNFEVIFSEFPHYYHWHTAFFTAQQQKIPFYGAVMSEKKNAFFFASNSDQFMDPSPAWHTFKDTALTPLQSETLANGIAQRKLRKVSHTSVYPQMSQKADLQNLLDHLNPDKPVAFFPVNVFFDLAVFKQSPVFTDLLEMLTEVILFFNKNPQYQLILKAHPAERLFYETSYSKAAESCLKNVLIKNSLELTPNIIFLDYDVNISTFDIIPHINLGLVFTSTTTVEMAWEGKPVIAVSDNHYLDKGFTIEPKNKIDFRKKIHTLLTHPESPIVIKQRRELSKKYYLLYYYHGFVNFNLMQGNDTGSVPSKLLLESYQQLLPGSNEALDYICDAVLTQQPIFGDQRWPPITT